MRRALLLIAVVVVTSCGGGSKGPTAPSGPQYPQIAGTYTSATFITLQFLFGDGTTASDSCSGSATLTQSGGTFSGSFLIGAPCDPISGSVVSGNLNIDGGVNFGITIPGGDPNAFTTLTGCAVISGGSAFNGAIVGRNLDASLSASLFCAGIGNVLMTFRMTGTR